MKKPSPYLAASSGLYQPTDYRLRYLSNTTYQFRVFYRQKICHSDSSHFTYCCGNSVISNCQYVLKYKKAVMLVAFFMSSKHTYICSKGLNPLYNL